MDMSEYKKEFVAESQEHLDTLNDGLLVLEKDSGDEDNINSLFRAFHTLKGNSAAMGFAKFSELSHSLEDVLSSIRDKKTDVNQEVMDLLFEGCDLLEQGLAEIDKGDPDNIEVESVISKSKKILGATEEVFEVNINPKLDLSSDESKKIKKLSKSRPNLFRVILLFDEKNFLKSAKSSLILRNLSDSCEIIRSNPSSDDIKQGKFASEVEIVVATKEKKEHVQDIVDKISGTLKFYVLEKNEVYSRPDELLKASDSGSEKSKDKASDSQEVSNEKSSGKSSVVKEIQSVRVSMTKLDKFMDLVGELLINNIQLNSIAKKNGGEDLKGVLSSIDLLISELRDEVMSVRMVPIGNIFNRFPRMVRDLASKEKKKVNLVVEGQEIEFDRTILDELGDPLVHLLRNSVDHGIEEPEVRQNLGKDETGTIRLIARREKNNAIIEIIDDGGGIDPELVKKSSIAKGLITSEQAAAMTDKDFQMLIFNAGVSTNEKVTDVSGRGVGMDVVMDTIKHLGGFLDLESEKGKGTKITIKLPLTIAIINSLLVESADNNYAIPLTNVSETLDIKLSDIKTINNENVFILRGTSVPIYWLEELVGSTDFEKKDVLRTIVVHAHNGLIGLVVDDIHSQQQILIKSLPGTVKKSDGFSGATILGDGTVALIIDVNTLFHFDGG